MRVLTDVSVGDWIMRRAGTWATAGGVAGTGFEAYARVLHPLPVDHRDGRSAQWPWAEVARRRDKVMHPLVQSTALVGGPEAIAVFDEGWSVDRRRADEGRPPLDLLRTLLDTLGDASTTHNLVAAIWHGWGLPDGLAYLFSYDEAAGWTTQDKATHEAQVRATAVARVSDEFRRAVNVGPRLNWPGREMVLFATTFEEIGDPSWPESAGIDEQPLAMLWPADRSWVLASEIDWDFTIVAGSATLIERIVTDSRWEAVAVSAEDDLSWAGDTINEA